jgi:8-oxo-dGTP pyrophosphatase MutT (NUDIX family)
MNERERVAAVCWRRTPAGGLEFLLVRTTAGDRWTFPKGGVDPGDDSPADAARREAREEAGVEGIADPEPLRRYQHLAHLDNGGRRPQNVDAWLVQVTGTAGPAEPGRRPTWFTPPAAAAALAENQSGPEAVAEVQEVLAEAGRRLDGEAGSCPPEARPGPGATAG